MGYNIVLIVRHFSDTQVALPRQSVPQCVMNLSLGNKSTLSFIINLRELLAHKTTLT